jgi:hypothetical protein
MPGSRFLGVTTSNYYPNALQHLPYPRHPIGLAKYRVPSSTDARIEILCERIRSLCGSSLTPESEDEIRRVAQELRSAIDQHVSLAKSSLSTKQAAISARDPEGR